jgi:hypothetical protein
MGFDGALAVASARRRGASSFGFWAARLVMGILLGFPMFLIALRVNNAIGSAPLTYALVYVPIRVAEWGGVGMAMREILGAGHGRFGMWVLGGICVSFAADIPLALTVGLIPLGRPFC